MKSTQCPNRILQLGLVLSLHAPAPRIQIKLCKIREIDTEQFRNDIFTNITAPCNDLNSYVGNYNSTLSELLDEHAPHYA